MTVQFVEVGGQKIAMLPAADYDQLVDMAENNADVLAAEKAESRRLDGEEYVPFSLIESVVNGENALRVWRNYRGMTIEKLAAIAGTRKAMVSDMENGKAYGKPALWRALADALDVTVDDILPES